MAILGYSPIPDRACPSGTSELGRLRALCGRRMPQARRKRSDGKLPQVELDRQLACQERWMAETSRSGQPVRILDGHRAECRVAGAPPTRRGNDGAVDFVRFHPGDGIVALTALMNAAIG